MISDLSGPMKIGFDVAQTCGLRAGCACYADSLIRAMVAVAPEHQYNLYHRFGGWLDTDPSRGTQIDAPCVNRPFAGMSEKTARLLWKDLAKGKGELPGNPQIVQSNAFQAPLVGNAKLVVVVHDVSFWAHPEFTTEGTRLGCQSGVCDALRRADGFIFVSQSSMDEFERFLPGWLERNQKPAIAIPLASRLNAEEGGEKAESSYWLALGSLEPRKNYETLLAAMELYWQRSSRRIPLHMGGGDGWRNERLLSRVAQLGKAGMVRRLGYVPDQELPRLYNAAMALVFPSWYEGFGLPVLEAMQCGCPVISSNRTSLPEIGGSAVSYIEPESPESICNAMLRMETEPDHRSQLVAAGRERASMFSWENTARSTLEFYRKILTKPT